MKWFETYRMRLVLVGLVAAVVLCGRSVKADFTFGEATSLGPTVNSSAIDGHSSVSADGLSLFFYSERSGGYGGRDIWVATRATTDEDWASVENLGPPVNTSYRESAPSVSADGLMLFFDSDRPGGSGGLDVWVTVRQAKDDPWTTPMNLGPTVNSSAHDYYASVSADGLVLFFDSDRGGSGDEIWMTTRQTTDDPWTTSVILGPPVNSSAEDGTARISPDGLALFFASTRSGGYGSGWGGWNVWIATRTMTDGDWGTAANLGPTINSPSGAAGAIPSADGSTLHFTTPRSGSGDLWQAPIIPIVDLSGDGIVDSADMCIIVDHWGTDNSLCDIGPMPWGDGIVDVEDMKILAEYLFEEVDDPTLIAHWPLDEAQGGIAYNNTANCDGTLNGGPLWQPDDGMVDGAILLDGIDDYISTDTILNPGDGTFSIVAWIKGGAPGQVIFSQTGGSNWLCLDSVEGYLITELTGFGRTAGPLMSQTYITDDNWHRIGFVWDGSYRILYVDGIEVAKDTSAQNPLKPSDGGLYIGAGKTLSTSTFFSGLIDDIRIYNRAVHP